MESLACLVVIGVLIFLVLFPGFIKALWEEIFGHKGGGGSSHPDHPGYPR